MDPQRNHKTLHPTATTAEGRQPHRQALGRRGEAVAASWLVARGFRLLANNWRYGRLEVDLLAVPPGQPRTLVVVEVKTWVVPPGSLQRAAAWGERPEHAVDARKRQLLARAGRGALAAFAGFSELRFDWVAIRVDGGRCRLLHVPDAFFPGA